MKLFTFKRLSIVIVLLLLGSFIYGYILFQKPMFELATSLASVSTFIMSLVLFNKIGVDASLKEKQLEEVVQLIQFLQKNFTGKFIQTNTSFLNLTYDWIDTEHDSYSDEDFQKYYHGRELILGKEYLHHVERELKVFATKPLLPKSIAIEVSKLTFGRYRNTDISFLKGNDVAGVFISEEEGELMMPYSGYKDEYLKVDDFIERLIKIKRAIAKWVKANTTTALDINI